MHVDFKLQVVVWDSHNTFTQLLPLSWAEMHQNLSLCSVYTQKTLQRFCPVSC